jgi:hypothetical protein
MWRFGECIIEGGPLHGFGEWFCCILLLSYERGVCDWLGGRIGFGCMIGRHITLAGHAFYTNLAFVK